MTTTKKLFGEANTPYYIYAPPYEQNSGGVRAMHYLCHALNLAGEEAYVLTDKVSDKLRTPSLSDPIIQRHTTAGVEPIVVYPEVTQGNPLGFRNVARFLLNIPGFLTGEKTNWQPSDMIFSLSMEIIPQGMKGDLLELPLIDSSIYWPPKAEEEKREGTLLFVNRFFKRGGVQLPVTEQSTEISFRVARRSPEELAELYRKAELLYTYEHSTACYEALLCGCPVVYIPNDIMLPERTSEYLGPDGSAWGLDPVGIETAKKSVFLAQKKYQALEEQFWTQLASFITSTQARARENKMTAPLARPRTATLDQAIAHYNAADYEAATEMFSILLETDPEEALVYTYLAFICANQGLLEDAAAFIEQARELSPERPELPAALGEVLLKAGHPKEAQKYLGMAVMQQSDFFGAYPALAEALRRNGNTAAAIELLESGAKIPSTAQKNIREVLLDMLRQCGDVAARAELCRRMQDEPDRHAEAIQLLADSGAPPESIYAELESWISRQPRHGDSSAPRKQPPPRRPLLIGFLVSSFAPGIASARLEALLLHLPPEKFRTAVIDNSAADKMAAITQRCFVLSDYWLSIDAMTDTAASEAMDALNIDILIDMNGFDHRHRLSLLLGSSAPFKASWSDILPWHCPGIIPVTGTALLNGIPTGVQPASIITLDDAGEITPMPAISASKTTHPGHTQFACLSPAGKIGAGDWQFFAQLLSAIPNGRLTINLEELEPAAAEFISGIFTGQGVAASRLAFISATSTSELCAAWREVDIGLAPLHGTGDLALSTALWMNTPFIALASPHPWSCRPAALLRSSGLGHLIAASEAEYLRIAMHLASEPPTLELRPSLPVSQKNAGKHFAREFGKALINTCFGKAK